MSGFNYIMLGLAGIAVLLFLFLATSLAKRTRGEGLEAPDARPAPRAAGPVPALRIVPTAAAMFAPTNAPFPAFSAWRLASRALANPDSAGGPLYRLRLVPEDDLPNWQPGAVARIYCGPPQDVLGSSDAAAAQVGDYMIGSLPDDGAVDLVVRDTASGSDGNKSHWLCHDIDIGHQVALALRDEPGFTPPPVEVPLILIGNATGIAALQAHLKARPAGTRNWLIFGDRNSADDQVLAAEISEWVSTGHLERCDLVFPGEGEEQRHVTDQIRDAQTPILDWTLAGGAIYVCGSQRMGDDVHAVLSTLLDSEGLEAMASEGLYRQLVY